jgi:hypothetical protein
MKRYLSVSVLLIFGLLLASLAGSYLLQDSGPVGARRQTPTSALIPVDDKVYLSARRLAHEADTIDERSLARDAIRLSDRELDQAFASSTAAGFRTDEGLRRSHRYDAGEDRGRPKASRQAI